MTVRGPGMQAAKRSDIDDAAARRLEIGIGSLGGEERAARIRVEHRVPLLDGNAFEGGGFVAAGVIDEDVETTESAGGGFDALTHFFGVAYIHPKRDRLNAMGFEVGDCLAGFCL